MRDRPVPDCQRLEWHDRGLASGNESRAHVTTIAVRVVLGPPQRHSVARGDDCGWLLICSAASMANGPFSHTRTVLAIGKSSDDWASLFTSDFTLRVTRTAPDGQFLPMRISMLNAELFDELLKKMMHKHKKASASGPQSPARAQKGQRARVLRLDERAPYSALHFLRGYDPDLNPDKRVWSHVKRTGTARRPMQKGGLATAE